MFARKPGHSLFILIFLLVSLLTGCNSGPKEQSMFETLDDSRTGLHFANKLKPDSRFNLFNYMYYYNGAGVGAGDMNNDGLIDLFFCANQSGNKLYLNTGELHFKDISTEAGIPQDGAWSTGVSIADVNSDGLLDIYICRVGKYEILNSHNQLLICQGIDKNGIPSYKDKAAEYGLDFSGFSTQAAFLDFDLDGDLDMFLLNHSIHDNSSYRPRIEFTGTYATISGARTYRNDGNLFSDITRATGINSTSIGYGLGIAIADINLDGYPDIYIGNDFHENDYLYINQKNGTFKEELNDHIMHTSRFTMGVDIADINNDAYPDIFGTDMLSDDPGILKRSLGEDGYDVFKTKLSYGYNYQYSRNNLQLNRRNGMFSEVGLYTGLAATDWSWSALWMDFNNDGLKDLFISNGIPKKMNDIDYINFVSNDEMQKKLTGNKMDENNLSLIEKFPSIRIPNKFFLNKGQLQFSDLNEKIDNEKSTYSNGSVYADLDNDGDLDIVVNNIDEPVLLYRNTANDNKTASYMDIRLKGPEGNINSLGAKVFIFSGQELRSYEKFPIHGFQSSSEIPLHIGLVNTKIDSAFLVWPDNSYQPLKIPDSGSVLSLVYRRGLPQFDYNAITSFYKNNTDTLVNITAKTGIYFKHEENEFLEFNREPLMPRMMSTEGPALAIADINNDKLDDIFIGSSRTKKSVIYIQDDNGHFKKTTQQAIDTDSLYEDVAACWADVNKDGFADLVVASGGNEYTGESEYRQPRVYLNDQRSGFIKRPDAFANIYTNASSVIAADFNGDGSVDLFVGGRSVPGEYGKIPQSFLLQNDGTGKFSDVSASWSKEISHAGFVTNASWCDIDKDNDPDLIISLEWGGIVAFINEGKSFTKKMLTSKNGWWNFILPYDIDNDGDIDLIAGNLGLNNRLKASATEPVSLYYNDFDDNGRKEQVLTYFLKGKEIPFANIAELGKQMPVFKKKFLYAADFAKAPIDELFSGDKLAKAEKFTADYFSNSILINQGGLNFALQELPWEAQLSSYRDAVIVNANNDTLPDILLAGNFYENNIEMGRYDADYSTLLVNKGNGNFSAENLNGIVIKGEMRHIGKLKLAGEKEAFVLVRNNDSTVVLTFSK